MHTKRGRKKRAYVPNDGTTSQRKDRKSIHPQLHITVLFQKAKKEDKQIQKETQKKKKQKDTRIIPFLIQSKEEKEKEEKEEREKKEKEKKEKERRESRRKDRRSQPISTSRTNQWKHRKQERKTKGEVGRNGTSEWILRPSPGGDRHSFEEPARSRYRGSRGSGIRRPSGTNGAERPDRAVD